MKGAIMILKVVVTKGEDGFFVATCPSLRSCWSQGRSQEEAIQNIREAIELFLEPTPNTIIQDAFHEVFELTL
jgi:predicted RNase H-like HicB family nuclease